MFKKRVSPFTCIIIAAAVCALTFVGVFARMTVKKDEELNKLRSQISVFASSAGLINAIGEDAENYEKLAGLVNAAKEHFLWDFNEEEVWDAIYKASLSSLGDQYTYYMNAEEYKKRNQGVGGNVGIGIRRTADPVTGGIYVVDVMEDSPAGEAGLLEGDVIIAIGEVKADVNDPEALIKRIQNGADGETLNFTVMRGGIKTDLELTLGTVPNDCVYSLAIDEKTRLIVISSFFGGTAYSEFCSELDKAIADGCEKLIFDLRDDGGGMLDQVTKILDKLLPEGDLVRYYDYDGSERVYRSDADHIDMPMAVLCNGGTASAAELFTCAMKDYGAAVIVGETTFGKGIMQNLKSLPDGSGFSITTSYYFPPSGENYHGTGVVPDHILEFEGEHDLSYYLDPLSRDNQLKLAYDLLNGAAE